MGYYGDVRMDNECQKGDGEESKGDVQCSERDSRAFHAREGHGQTGQTVSLEGPTAEGKLTSRGSATLLQPMTQGLHVRATHDERGRPHASSRRSPTSSAAVVVPHIVVGTRIDTAPRSEIWHWLHLSGRIQHPHHLLTFWQGLRATTISSRSRACKRRDSQKPCAS